MSILRLLLKIKHFFGGTGEVIEVKFKLKSREFFWKGREEGKEGQKYIYWGCYFVQLMRPNIRILVRGGAVAGGLKQSSGMLFLIQLIKAGRRLTNLWQIIIPQV